MIPLNIPSGIAPALFVVLWGTGFISAKFGLPYAGPLTFLLYRFALVAGLMLAVALLVGARWPDRPITWVHLIVAGLMVHGLYLGGVFVAMSRGMPAGTTSMLVGVQPILTVFLARWWFGERTTARQWWGLLLGLVGVYFVVEHKLRLTGFDWISFSAVLVALIAISVGTLYQKRYCGGVDLRIGSAVQFGGCALVYGILAPQFESLSTNWAWQFQFAVGWSVLVLSVGAISLLYALLRQGAAAEVARLFYLVPAVTAVMAYLLFEEPITLLALAGMALIAAGVLLARPPKPEQAAGAPSGVRSE